MDSLNKVRLLSQTLCSLCFGFAMYQVMLQSRPFRKVAVSNTSGLTALGIGVLSGALFWGGSVLLGMLYAKFAPTLGEFSFTVFLVRVLVGAITGAVIGAIFFVPIAGDLAILFLDYHGVILYFTGAVGGGIGAMVGAIKSTPGLQWWIRATAALGAGLAGMIIGFWLGAFFVILFTKPFIRRLTL